MEGMMNVLCCRSRSRSTEARESALKWPIRYLNEPGIRVCHVANGEHGTCDRKSADDDDGKHGRIGGGLQAECPEQQRQPVDKHDQESPRQPLVCGLDL